MSNGFLGVVVALHMCARVDMYGFSQVRAPRRRPEAPSRSSSSHSPSRCHETSRAASSTVAALEALEGGAEDGELTSRAG